MSLLTLMIASGKRNNDNGKVKLCRYNINNHDVYIVWEWNSAYGDICRQWSIDGNDKTTVAANYGEKERMLLCDCSNALVGVRAFAKESVSYEFLCKPLGVPFLEDHNKVGYRLKSGPDQKWLDNYEIPLKQKEKNEIN